MDCGVVAKGEKRSFGPTPHVHTRSGCKFWEGVHTGRSWDNTEGKRRYTGEGTRGIPDDGLPEKGGWQWYTGYCKGGEGGQRRNSIEWKPDDNLLL